jgi:hypothetical protein
MWCPPRFGTCSGIGGRSAALPTHPATPSSATGWANQGYTATDIDPLARGVGWLLAEGGTKRVKAAYLSDTDVDYLAMHAARCRRKTPSTEGGVAA